MKKLIFLLLPLFCTAAEYEFLTPQAVVIKGKTVNPAGVISSMFRGRHIWKKESGLLRDKDGKIRREPDVIYYQYIILKKPLSSGEKCNPGEIVLQYDKEKPSHIFKLNQVGNGLYQKKKFAYMGAWLGRAGAFPLKHLAGKVFELRKSSDGKCVYKNTLRLRRDDPEYIKGVPFTGEEVLELDYSEFRIPGKYYFYVDGIGRSMDFTIGSETLNEAFYIHARGLYHKRCGIEKRVPFTAWESPACHKTVVRGLFPGNKEHYRKGNQHPDSGFFNIKEQKIEVKVFDLIKEYQQYKNEIISAPGGWHDAADYDRRPFHLRIVNDLATVYLMKPENFIDGQLNIPESGNGIPDILDEAAWGLKHLLAVQQENGGVGTWFETTGHPGPGEGLPDQEKRTYYVSAPSRNGTLEYAAAASMLAIAMKKAGAGKNAEKYQNSAIRAWNFAQDPRNRHVAWFRLQQKMISYREEPELNAENLLKSGINLYLLTGEKKYLEPILNHQEQIKKMFRRDYWKWSPLCWMMLELHPVRELDDIRQEYRKKILDISGKMLSDQESAYPYRTLWHAHNAAWVHAMAWGTYHPLRRAMTLIAAHKITGDEKYLTGAYLANDFHNGANPLGRSMTSGLGKIYPVVFLDLVSYADRIGEFVPGITPYGNTFGMDRNAVKMVYGKDAEKLPIFRRYVNLEFLSVPSSEYSVWETIAPAAVTTGYLIEKPTKPLSEWKSRKPAADYRKLPGYRALP